MALRDSFHISWQNDLAAFTLSSDVSAETAYPLTNLQSKIANKPLVIDMTGETTVAITDTDGATDRSATCFALHNHNFPDGTTVRLRLYPDATQGGTAVYDSGEVDVMHNVPFGALLAGIDQIEGNFEDESSLKTHVSLWFDTVTYKSFQIDITNDSGFTDDLLQVDKGWLGAAYCPEYGPEQGFESNLIEGSEHQRKPGGGMETVQREVRRSLALEFKVMSNAERHTIRHMLDRAKKSGDLLVTMDPNDAKSMNYELTSIYRRTSSQSFVARFFNGNDMALMLEEN
ncbi:MAG: hypothetical protein R3332_00475 [Pseudohongiellaceae bacterium]|nr:hypothetical protein [Pseudohongiellaceae bacterium]